MSKKTAFGHASTNLYCHKSRLVVEDNARPFQVINKTSDFISQTTAMPSRITKRFFFSSWGKSIGNSGAQM